MIRSPSVLTLLSLLGLTAATSSVALAQDNAAAGLFVSEARQLPLVAQSLTVRITGDEALVHLTQDFLNDGETQGQADYQLFLPEGASVEGFGFWNEDRFFEAKLQEKEEAEAAHAQAAAAGRTTGLVKSEDQLSSFSVYPVEAGAVKRVESTLRVPVEMDLGRSQLRLPIDRFLGQAGPDSTVMVELTSLEPLTGFGVVGVDTIVLGEGARSARFAWSTDAASTLWWQEESPPLLVRAERVPLGDDAVGLQLRVVLHDAGAATGAGDAAREVHLFVDGSFSMGRRAGAVQTVVQRLQERVSDKLVIHGVADGKDWTVDGGAPARSVVDGVLGQGHSATWTGVSRAMQEAGCGGAVRCVVLADAQLEGLPDSRQANAEILLLADTHEKAWMPDRSAAASVFQPGVEPEARLRSLTDELVLPVLEIAALRLGERDLSLLGEPRLRVAEGGMLKVYGVPEDAMGDTLTVLASLGGEAVNLEVPLGTLDGASAEGRAARKGWYRAELRRLMQQYRDAPDESLKGVIVDLSLREGIPTAFTALQVDDPELSLVAIKPGDPVLTVHGEAGLSEVAAWYPFGDARRLVRNDAGEGAGVDFSDRFLVPRSWEERAYRVEVFKGFSDGSGQREQVWYVLDEQAPTVSLHLEAGQLVVDAGEEAPEIGSVRVQVDGRELALAQEESADGLRSGPWSVDVSELGEVFDVLVRDRAGNRSSLRARLDGGRLEVEAGERSAPERAEEAEWSALPVAMGGGAGEVRLRVDGGHLVVSSTELQAQSDEPLSLRSLVVSSSLPLADGGLLVGTRGGDLVHVDASGAVSLLDLDQPEHPVTGLAYQDDGAVLVGVLGVGLMVWDGAEVRESGLEVGSAFVTGVERLGDGTVLVGTAYNGLWRVRGHRSFKTRFPSDHVTGFEVVAGELQVRSGLSTWTRAGTDRYEVAETSGNGLPQRAPDLTAAVRWQGQTIVAGFDTGLWRLDGDAAGADVLVELPLGLDVHASRVNDLAVYEGALWLATEGGTWVVEADGPGGSRPRKVADAASHDLDVDEAGVAVASSGGLLVFPDAASAPYRLDTDGSGAITAGTGKWMSVAWHGGGLYAGGMEGLVRFSPEAAPVTVDDGFDANWVTALLSTDEGLVVGTYASGVWQVEEAGERGLSGLRAEVLPGLEAAWVPPHALATVDGQLWVGGIGEAPKVRDADGSVTALRLPARDTNGFLGQADGTVLVVTSDGLAQVGEAPLAARVGDP